MKRQGAARAVVLALGWAWALVVGACSSAAPEQPPLHIVATSPEGETQDARALIRFHFDRPAVAESALSDPLEDSPARIEPALETVAHWVDRQTLVIKPKKPMADATRYRVQLLGALRDRVEGEASFEFVHDPLKVISLAGLDPEWAAPDPSFSLLLSHAVKGSELASKCALIAETKDANVALRAAEPDAISKEIALVSTESLTQGASYTLSCQGAEPATGNEPLSEPFKRTLKVLPVLQVREMLPDKGSVAPDELRLKIRFSAPVEPEVFTKHVRIRPKVEKFESRWVRESETDYAIEVNLEASSNYTMTVSGKLVDAFGQRLGKTKKVAFQTLDARPNIQMETGIYAVEAKGKGYPIWTRNVSDWTLQCAHVPKDKLVSLLTSQMDYDPWYYDGFEPLDWRAQRLRPTRHKLGDAEGTKNRWRLHRVDLPETCGKGKRGVYLAQVESEQVLSAKQAHHGYYPYRVLGNVTDLGVLLKVGPASGLTWVTQLSDGEPVAGAAVTLYAPNGKRVHVGRTDKIGVARIPGSAELRKLALGKGEIEEVDYYRAQRMIAVVEKGDDLAVVDGNWANGIQTWNFGLTSDRHSEAKRLRGFIHTDRGLYRPGETVHIKGLAREVTMGAPPSVPTARKVELVVEDSRGGTLQTSHTRLSKFGSFNLDVALASEAQTGDYFVVATVAGQVFRQAFSVEEFRPVSFEVAVKPRRRHQRIGRTLRANVAADYLFGAPVAEASVEWTLRRRRKYIHFADYAQYTFRDRGALDYWSYYYWDEQRDTDYVSEGDGLTDEKGRFGIEVKDPQKGLTGAFDYILRATVTDPTDQSVSGTKVVTAHPTDHYLGVHAQEWVQAVNMPFAVNLVALKPDGTATAAEAELTFARKSWECQRRGTYRTWNDCKESVDVVMRRPVEIPDTGPAVERILPESPGEFLVRVSGKDARGRRVVASTSIWVIGEGQAFWSGDESARMGLIASKTRYLPGETARLVARADAAGSTMLVTTERDGIVDARVVRPAESSAAIDIPLDVKHAPNVYVSVAMVRGRRGESDAERPEFKLGIANLDVSAEEQRLTVSVETEREVYEPGQTVKGTVRVLRNGSPAEAEIALSAADEGILQLIGFQTPDPMKAFYAPWGLGVDNGTNLNRIVRLNTPSGADGEEGADGSGGNEVRSRFVASALWKPSLLTDDSGEASFSFIAPDNLTAFRLMAVAADAGAMFGASDSRIRIKKDLLLQPVLPRFVGRGDTLSLSAVVHNYTKRKGKVSVTASAEGIALAETSGTASVPAGKSGVVRFSGKVTSVDNVRITLGARMGMKTDGVRLDLPVRRPLVREAALLAGGHETNVSAQLTYSPQADPELSGVEISVDRTGLAGLGPSLRYLVQYPYGCLEQTLSRVVPMLKVRDLAESLAISEVEGTKLESYVKFGLAKVLRHQHYDGHFSLWPSSKTQPHLTAYALFGLSEAKRAGFDVAERPIKRAVRALRNFTNRGDYDLAKRWVAANMAMAAYVLADAGEADSTLNTRLFEGRATLPLYGRAMLLRALIVAKGDADSVETLVGELVAGAVGKGEGKIIQETGERLWYQMSSDVRSTAMVISALLDLERPPSIVNELVLGLRSVRTAGRWANTQDNAYALIAMSDYARTLKGGRAKVTVRLGDTLLQSQTLTGSDVLHLERSASVGGGRLSIESDEPAYISVIRHDVRESRESEPADKGMVVRRTFEDFETATPITTFKVGQLVRVKLALELPEERRYVALTDPIAAGFEPVNGRFATSVTSGTDDSQVRSGFNFRDLRDDRVDFFADSLRAGTHETSYVVRATIAGSFTSPPARTEEMYSPHVYGTSAATNIEIVR